MEEAAIACNTRSFKRRAVAIELLHIRKKERKKEKRASVAFFDGLGEPATSTGVRVMASQRKCSLSMMAPCTRR